MRLSNIKLNRYLKTVKSNLLLIKSASETEKIMNMIQEQIMDYVSKHPSASVDEIRDNVILVNEIVKVCFIDTNPDNIQKRITDNFKFRKRIKLFIFIACIMLCVSIIYGVKYIIHAKQTAIAYYTEEIIDYGDIPSTDETDSTEYTSESFSEPDSAFE